MLRRLRFMETRDEDGDVPGRTLNLFTKAGREALVREAASVEDRSEPIGSPCDGCCSAPVTTCAAP